MNNLMTRSFLSYADLKKEAVKDIEAGGGGDDEWPDIETRNVNKTLKPFFVEAGLVKEEMASIRDLLALLETANQESKTARKMEETRAARGRINGHIVEVLKKARRIRERLEAMDRANAGNRRLSGCHEGTPVDRARTSVTNGLRKKLKEMMMEFQELRQRMMADYREAVERRYFALTGELPPEEVVEKIIAEGKSEEMLNGAVVGDRSQVLETAHEMQNQHDAAKEVERSLLELHQVFLDMAVMVEAQGEKMDDIEHHVTSAARYVKDGAMELNSAKGYQKRSRKGWFCIAVVLLLVVVLLIVITTVTSPAKS